MTYLVDWPFSIPVFLVRIFQITFGKPSSLIRCDLVPIEGNCSQTLSVPDTPGVPGKSQIPGLTPRVSESVGLRWGLIICISNKFLGTDNVANPGTTLGEALI